jgi:predicted regulator of Ras-like GTPase activity (Roadblock/LC7/MglB family)
MDAKQALAELVELSSQVRSAVVLGSDGAVLASTSDDPAAAESLARIGLELVDAARELHAGDDDVTRVEVDLEDGALFVVRGGGRTVAATTGPEPTAGLVVYDLRTCLDRIDEEPKPKRRRRTTAPKESA